MTSQEFNDINWHRGNVAKLQNGKEYLVKGTKSHGKYLLLYSQEYDKCFVADYKIVECRTSDYEEPEEVYLEMKRQKMEEAAAKREAERQEYLRAKAERRQKNIEAQQRAHQEALARKAAAKAQRQKDLEAKKESVKVTPNAVPIKEQKPVKPAETKKEVKAVKEEAPALDAPKKRVRQRIRVAAVPVREKVEYFKKK